ncbi:MAG: 16S rRNA (cytosine(1402)-N(4))-methyltransferase RsmH [Myxococcota bacterium]|jgi:16S rRNA (cytosine1402-N4)-methyltransferase|nr:16S rRNA (cytosine(1402)-N(4))-methyltransferase RsmH [Myxococcota bacterium]
MDVPFEHEPVLLEEVMTLLAPHPGGVYCDATVGGGGHAEAILAQSSPDGRLVGIDRDPMAVRVARQRLARFADRVTIVHGDFGDLDSLLGQAGVSCLDGLLVDLGVSSHQLDVAQRGFSFMRCGPLDMRMDTTAQESATTLLERLTEDELADIIYRFGEERHSRRIAASIKRMSREGGLQTTEDLAVAVRRVMGRPPASGLDPATRTFQAIRIAVNRELEQLESLLGLLPEPLALGGRVVIISFHSLEDRLVKQRFSSLVNPCICPPGMPVCPCPPPVAEPLTRRAVRVSASEQKLNPRARSSRVRAVRRIL